MGESDYLAAERDLPALLIFLKGRPVHNPLFSTKRRLITSLITGFTALSVTVACSGPGAQVASSESSASTATSTASISLASAELFDSSTIHAISVEYDEAEYQAMIATFVASGTKEWISATVTIDGTRFENVGIKLKGNSTLQGLRGSGPGNRPRTDTSDSTTSSSETTATNGSGTAAAEATPETSTAETSTAETSTPETSTAESDTATSSSSGASDGPSRVGGGGGLGGDISADEPEGLPWRIRLDKFVKGQNYQGQTDIVVRGGNSETGLNEAVALELLGAAGLATQEAISTRFSVNGSAQTLRLVIQNPNDIWYDETFANPGILYKAEAGGDYSYRGEDPTSYLEVFEIEAASDGLADDYAPLIRFLKFINESDDATFAAELGNYLEVDSFADYLAVQELVANSDDIDGPGNNSYLQYDQTTQKFTVVSWDQNLSFGGMRGMGGFGGGVGGGRVIPSGGVLPSDGAIPSDRAFPSDMTPPVDGAFPTDAVRPGGAGGMGPGGGMGGRGGNILVQRFQQNTEFAAAYQSSLSDLRALLYTSGTAEAILDTWTNMLLDQATDLVSADIVKAEAATIKSIINGA